MARKLNKTKIAILKLIKENNDSLYMTPHAIALYLNKQHNITVHYTTINSYLSQLSTAGYIDRYNGRITRTSKHASEVDNIKDNTWLGKLRSEFAMTSDSFTLTEKQIKTKINDRQTMVESKIVMRFESAPMSEDESRIWRDQMLEKAPFALKPPKKKYTTATATAKDQTNA